MEKVKGPLGFALVFMIGSILIIILNRTSIIGRILTIPEIIGWYYICKKGFDKWTRS